MVEAPKSIWGDFKYEIDGVRDYIGLQEIYSNVITPSVITELDSAIRKHTFDKTPMNPFMDVKDGFIILAEEVGEVARALTYDEGDRDKLDEELTQVIAMATAMKIGLVLKEELGI